MSWEHNSERGLEAQPLIPVLRRKRQVDLEFVASLVYRVRDIQRNGGGGW